MDHHPTPKGREDFKNKMDYVTSRFNDMTRIDKENVPLPKRGEIGRANLPGLVS